MLLPNKYGPEKIGIILLDKNSIGCAYSVAAATKLMDNITWDIVLMMLLMNLWVQIW